MKLIALSGYARSGKDEAAKVLVEEFGFTRIAFADKLRDFLYALNPVVGRGSDFSDRPIIYLHDVIDEVGWEGYKQTEHGTEIRRLLQRLGTEAGRQTLWDTIWIDAALKDLEPEGKYAITDCRFPNEAQAIRDRGGKIWRVIRDGVGPANNHPSETSLDDYKFDGWIINNFKTVEMYRESVKNYYKSQGRVFVG